MADDLPPNVRVVRDVQYGKEGAANQLDLYLPTKMQANTPVIIWIHGGGWESGSKEPCPAIFMVDKGYAVASINYRLSKDKEFPAQMHDCKEAVRWLRANAKQYNLDPERFGVFGASSGGHLAALLGTSSGVQKLEGTGKNLTASSSVQAVCDLCGPTDLKQFAESTASMPGLPANLPNKIVTQLLGGPVEQKKELAQQANPITYVSEKSPPFLIMHGADDALVPVEQSKLLERALKKAGAKVDLHVVPGAGHQVAAKANMRLVESFFDKTLRGIEDKDRGKGEEVKLAATFRHKPGTQAGGAIEFYSNGRLQSPDSLNTWTLDGDKLTLCWYSLQSPTGVWVDSCTLAKDGQSFQGQNQKGVVISGELSGGGNLRDVATRSPAVDTIPSGYNSEPIRKMPFDTALGRATGARWIPVEGGYSIPLSGPTPSERKDAISQFTAIIKKEMGSTEGLSFTETRITINEALAKKIVDKFGTLQAQNDPVPGRPAADFIRKFSGANAPLSTTTLERAKADAQRLAELASTVPGIEKPTVKMDRLDVKLLFKDQAQTDKFSELLAQARKKAGISKESFDFAAAKDQKSVSVRYADLNGLTDKEITGFFTSAEEAIKEGKNKGKEEPDKMGAAPLPNFLRALQASVGQIEQKFGEPKPKPAEAPEGAQLPAPRFAAAIAPITDKGLT